VTDALAYGPLDPFSIQRTIVQVVSGGVVTMGLNEKVISFDCAL
jgi:hypothetical protein